MSSKPERFLEIYDKNEDISKPSPWSIFYVNETINYWGHGQPLAHFSFQKSGKNTLTGNIKNVLGSGLIIIDCGKINDSNVDSLGDVEGYIEDRRTIDGVEPIVFIDEADFSAANRFRIHHHTIYPYIGKAISHLVSITNESKRAILATNIPTSVDSTLLGLFRPIVLFLPLPNSNDRLLIIKQILEINVSSAPPIILNASALNTLVQATKYSPTGWLIGFLNIIRSRGTRNISIILKELNRLPIKYSKDERADFKKTNGAFLLGETRARFPFGRH